jgi:hypothetical protein
MARRITISGAGDFDFGNVHPGFTGRWIIQVISISSLTLTPKVSVDDDGNTFVTRAITPADNSTDVTSIAAPGLWFMDAGTARGRLTSVGAGSAVVLVQPAIG